MSEERFFEFFPRFRTPYVEYVIEYAINEKEGFLYFDGYYYVADEELPRRAFFTTGLMHKEENPDKGSTNVYKITEQKYYEVEIYKVEKVVDTSEFSEIEEEDGSVGRICFFPTHEQKIYFKMIREFDKYGTCWDAAMEHFNKSQGSV